MESIYKQNENISKDGLSKDDKDLVMKDPPYTDDERERLVEISSRQDGVKCVTPVNMFCC